MRKPAANQPNVENEELDLEDEEFDLGEELDLEDEYEDQLEDEHEVEPEQEDKIETIDLSGFTPSIDTQTRRSIDVAGVVSVISSKNGRRIELSKQLMDKIGNPQTVQIGLSDTQMVFAENLGDAYTSYSLSKSGRKKVIYRSELVKQIIERYELDFTSKTSITFQEAIYKTMGSKPIAFIPVKN